MPDKPRTISEINESLQCGGHSVLDADNDGLLLDDILRLGPNYNSLIIPCAADYLAKIGELPSVTAGSNPNDPREMKWQFDGVDQFVLIKKDGAMEYRELTGELPDKKEWKLNGYGVLFGLVPWFVKSDAKAGVDAVAIRTPEYWIKRYEKSASAPILAKDDIKKFNEEESAKIPKVDYRLNEIHDTMPIKEIVDLIERAYLLGANEHFVGKSQCSAGAGGKLFTGDLDDKSETWTLEAWSRVAVNYALSVEAHKVKGCKDAEGNPLESFDLDFSKAKTLSDKVVPVDYGIIVNQTDLRAIPSEEACYAANDSSQDDGCEYHRPHIEPVRILWKGKGWYFVKTQQEYGWVREIDLAVAKRGDVDKLLGGTAVVKEFVFAKDLVRYGIGTRLPLAGSNEDSVTVEVPVRGTNGILAWKKKELPKYYFDIEPAYTYAGIVKSLLSEISEGVWLLANKTYLGIEGVDCSGATKMALEIPGLLLGRNSGGAQSLAGKSLWERPKELILEPQPDVTKLEESWNNNVAKLEESKKQVMQVFTQWHNDMLAGKKRGVLIVGWPGHVMVFLGLDEGGRAIVVSSISRVIKITESLHGAKPYEAKTESQWLLGPVVNALDSTETDSVFDRLVPGTFGRPNSYIGKITFIREII